MKRITVPLAAALMLTAGTALAQGREGTRMAFDFYDKDGNGVLSKAEVKGMARTMFTYADKNGDGRVAGEETLLGPRDTDLMDTDNSGAVEQDEAVAYLTDLILREDADDDGTISFEEYRN